MSDRPQRRGAKRKAQPADRAESSKKRRTRAAAAHAAARLSLEAEDSSEPDTGTDSEDEDSTSEGLAAWLQKRMSRLPSKRDEGKWVENLAGQAHQQFPGRKREECEELIRRYVRKARSAIASQALPVAGRSLSNSGRKALQLSGANVFSTYDDLLKDEAWLAIRLHGAPFDHNVVLLTHKGGRKGTRHEAPPTLDDVAEAIEKGASFWSVSGVGNLVMQADSLESAINVLRNALSDSAASSSSSAAAAAAAGSSAADAKSAGADGDAKMPNALFGGKDNVTMVGLLQGDDPEKAAACMKELLDEAPGLKGVSAADKQAIEALLWEKAGKHEAAASAMGPQSRIQMHLLAKQRGHLDRVVKKVAALEKKLTEVQQDLKKMSEASSAAMEGMMNMLQRLVDRSEAGGAGHGVAVPAGDTDMPAAGPAPEAPAVPAVPQVVAGISNRLVVTDNPSAAMLQPPVAPGDVPPNVQAASLSAPPPPLGSAPLLTGAGNVKIIPPGP